jgi:hypothetical protein
MVYLITPSKRIELPDLKAALDWVRRDTTIDYNEPMRIEGPKGENLICEDGMQAVIRSWKDPQPPDLDFFGVPGALTKRKLLKMLDSLADDDIILTLHDTAGPPQGVYHARGACFTVFQPDGGVPGRALVLWLRNELPAMPNGWALEGE